MVQKKTKSGQWACLLGFLLAISWFTAAGSEPDTAFADCTDSIPSYLPWLSKNWDKNLPFAFTERSALRGRKGLAINTSGVVRQKTGFRKNSWQRFYFRLDSVGDTSITTKTFFKERKNTSKTFFLSYVVSQKLQKEQAEAIVNFLLTVNAKDSGLGFSAQLNAPDVESAKTLRISILRGHRYCVETNMEFFSNDSVKFTCYVDGIRSGEIDVYYPYPLNFFEVKVSNAAEFYNIPFHFSFDEFAYSDKRLYTLPETTPVCSTIVEAGQVEMRCAPVPTHYAGEEIKAGRFRVFPEHDTRFPLFDIIEKVPSHFSQRAIPFSMDSGGYKWQVSFINNFNNWGGWSANTAFRIEAQDRKVRIKSAFFTEKGRSKPVSAVVAGKWYDFHLKLDSRVPWDSLMYVLVWINNETYTFGHLANKGGEFRASSNYIYNLSLFDGEYALLEKAGENSVASIRVPVDSPGKYLDASNQALVIDPARGEIKFRCRFLPSAKTGDWRLAAGAYYLDKRDAILGDIEGQSSLFTSTLTLMEESTRPGTAIWLIFGTLISLIGIFLYKKIGGRRVEQAPDSNTNLANMSQDPDYKWLMRYLEAHYTEKIVISDLLKEWHVSRAFFYEVMSRYNQNLPDLVHRFRIEKAKGLLRHDKGKSIEQVSAAVGYSDAAHFSKTFKNIEGILPKEYRNKVVSQAD